MGRYAALQTHGASERTEMNIDATQRPQQLSGVFKQKNFGVLPMYFRINTTKKSRTSGTSSTAAWAIFRVNSWDRGRAGKQEKARCGTMSYRQSPITQRGRGTAHGCQRLSRGIAPPTSHREKNQGRELFLLSLAYGNRRDSEE